MEMENEELGAMVRLKLVFLFLKDHLWIHCKAEVWQLNSEPCWFVRRRNALNMVGSADNHHEGVFNKHEQVHSFCLCQDVWWKVDPLLMMSDAETMTKVHIQWILRISSLKSLLIMRNGETVLRRISWNFGGEMTCLISVCLVYIFGNDDTGSLKEKTT